MKLGKLFWGFGLILAGVLILLDALGVLSPLFGIVGRISILALIAGVLLICVIIKELTQGKIASIFIPLALLFMLFEKNVARLFDLPDTNIVSNWLLLLIALLFTIGVSLLLPRNKRSFTFTFHMNDKDGEDEEDDDHPGSGHNSASSSISASTVYVDCRSFSPSIIENNLGSCTVHFKNPDAYLGNGVLRVDNNLGAMQIK